MPTQPTCKVVKREGQRGACIDPKGCKVRTTKDAQGNKKKDTKLGYEKIERTTTKRDMRLAVAGSPQRHLIANWNNRPQQFCSNYKSNHNRRPGRAKLSQRITQRGCPSWMPVQYAAFPADGGNVALVGPASAGGRRFGRRLGEI
eukprot:COSAG06_NODE_1033_length_11001_cov_5.119795_10_plen_145_part_00